MPKQNGGKRPGAGRPKGSKNLRSIVQAAEAAVDGTRETPLQYMLRNMNDPKCPVDRRDDMAKAAAPYVHSKLSSTEIKGDHERPIVLEVLRKPSADVDK